MTDSPRSRGRDPTQDVLARLFRDGRTNGLVAWPLVGILGLAIVENLLDPDLLWAAFVAAVGAVVLVPPVAHRDWRVMIPWEVLVVAELPIIVRGLFGGELGMFGSYISLAALALLITVELHMFTSLQMTHWFAVVFVVMVTLASVAAWSIVRYVADGVLGTAFLSTNEALMSEFLWVAVAGLAAGVLFDAYFRRRDRQLTWALRRVVRR